VSLTEKPSNEARRLWLRWVLANAVGEVVGLGITALVGGLVVFSLGEGSGVLATLGIAVLAVVAGTFVEGTVVGTAQWLVLRRPLPRMRWRTWALATGAGAFLAWMLGMIPSTVLSLGVGPSGGGEPQAEPSQALVYGLAFLMGLTLGPVLGFAQWLVLRSYVRGAALWMPANALAWAFGMVVIFIGIDPAIGSGFGALAVAILVFTLALAGAVVGAVHGLALVRLLRTARVMRGGS
jgi:hypothetical protein